MTLAEVIYSFIPLATLARVVYDQGILTQDEQERLFKSTGVPADEVAAETVKAYGADAHRLAYALYQQLPQADFQAARFLYEHFQGKGFSGSGHQASLVSRIPTLPLDKLSDFLNSVKSHVCLIVGITHDGSMVRGTGFLVAPDLVLTCRHVMKHFPNHKSAFQPNVSVEFWFDFYLGNPVTGVRPNIPGARVVGLSDQWLVESCEDVDPDGLDGELAPDVTARIKKSLDFALLRLDEKVGLQPMNRGGGRRRGWIDLPVYAAPQQMQPDDWIIIPQHPEGHPQQIDLGRFKYLDQTETRIRYSTNTAGGTSGAPCFNHEFELVGVHNAYVGPLAKPLANQAICFDQIAPALRTHLVRAASLHARRWSISRGNDDPRVVLGRDPLLTWLISSAKDSPQLRSERIYCAVASAPSAGCTFSLDVLEAETRETKIPRVVYGQRGQKLPDTVEDFMCSLIKELSIDTRGDPMPERPGQSSVTIGAEADKLDRWLSVDLPDWLDGVITRHVERKVDAREGAEMVVAGFEKQGIEAPQDQKDLAGAKAPVLVRAAAWDIAYVVIDDLRKAEYNGGGARTEFRMEVYDLVMALCKGKAESTMGSGLRRLRWMFLGYLPDGIPSMQASSEGATVELLNPQGIGTSEIVGLLERMSQTFIPMQKTPDQVMRGFAATLVEMAEAAPPPRLAALQGVVNNLTKNLLREGTEDERQAVP